MSLFSELKRRNVIRVGTAYVVAAWLIIQVVETIFPVYGLPDSAIRLVITLLAVGLVPVLVLAWVFELTPEGLRRESEIDPAQPAVGESALNKAILVLLALAVGYFTFDKFVLDPAEDEQIAEIAKEEGRSEAISDRYGPRSIAVLPFRNMSGDPDQAYFGEGLAIEFITLLTRVSPQLRVTPYRSSFHFGGKDLDIPAISEALNVDHVLEGAFTLDGGQVRITVSLTDAQADTVMWSDSFERPWQDLTAVQGRVAEAVVRQLRVELLDAVPTPRQPDPSAYRLYLQALHLWKDWELGSLHDVADLLQQALAIDAEFVSAWVRLADVEGYLWARCDPGHEHYAAFRESLFRALMLEPDHPEALAHFGVQQFIDSTGRPSWDWVTLADLTGRALAQEPSNPFVLWKAATALWHLGRLDEAISVYEYLADMDPANSLYFTDLGWLYLGVDRVDDAMAHFETALLLSPETMEATEGLAKAWLLKGEPEKAAELLPPRQRGYLDPIIRHALGEQEASDELLARWIEAAGSAEASGSEQAFSGFYAYRIAKILAARGETDRAFEWLDKAVDHDYVELLILTSEVEFRDLREDPRWQGVLERTGRSPEQLAEIGFEVTLPRDMKFPR